MNDTPFFVDKNNIGFGTIINANPTYIGDGTLVEVFEAGINGSIIDRIEIQSRGTNPACVLNFFFEKENGDKFLFFSQEVSATTTSETVGIVPIVLEFGFKLEKNMKVLVGSTAALDTGINVMVLGGDY